MSHEQLYYPNITPTINAKLAVSLLHWDRVMRIFPKEGTAHFRPSHGILRDLEAEGILVGEPLEYEDIDKATSHFERLVAITDGRRGPQRSAAQSLVSPLSRLRKTSNYYIYRGKANLWLHDEYPKYFRLGRDSNSSHGASSFLPYSIPDTVRKRCCQDLIAPLYEEG